MSLTTRRILLADRLEASLRLQSSLAQKVEARSERQDAREADAPCLYDLS